MMDLNDFAYFAAVVEHGGFTAASRATGVDKARLSRHVAALEERLRVRLLQRSTRSVVLTQAGKSFYEGCMLVIDGARVACESVLEFQREPSGTIRIGSPVIIAQNFLAPILPRYLAANPKVSVVIESTDRPLHPLEDRFDVILSAQAQFPDSSSLVAREIGRIRRILVAQPAFLAQHPTLRDPADLHAMPIIARHTDIVDESARWTMLNEEDVSFKLDFQPRLVTGDLQIQIEAACSGLGLALLPEPLVDARLDAGDLVRVLPDWFTPEYSLFLVYPTPRGILPSVRSFIDFALANMTVGRKKDRGPADGAGPR
ncbi:LysR substrate-binding domain-containing protein [Novosphingobium sp. KACC 22771]|uniref:LysR substrate-binding domain-containing protein n=1 Tax=Novosphingobium sp. KACC 22771 TaxID=3025670 RepID=UPI0023672EEC|nr:LysR substrate-binding domain-containing protein [Novosphingobium sp. KACC 22771]WDF75194.1 LysR substrate-binding domain-containing protein [Novosphingobium sp. KACC 22771]